MNALYDELKIVSRRKEWLSDENRFVDEQTEEVTTFVENATSITKSHLAERFK